MKKFIPIFLLALLVTSACLSKAATIPLTKAGSGDLQLAIGMPPGTEGFNLPSGALIRLKNGSTFIVDAGASVDLSAGNVNYGTKLNSINSLNLTSAGLALLDDANSGAQLITLGGSSAGINLFIKNSPSAQRYPRIESDNTWTFLTEAEMQAIFGGGGSGGVGTITSLTVGDLTGLFTSAVANSTTTPAVTYTKTNVGQNFVLAGQASGGTGPWNFRALAANDIPSLTLSKISDAGSLALYAAITPTTNVQQLLAAADFSAMRTLLVLRPGVDVESFITAGTTGQYRRGDKTWQTLNPTAVGLGNVPNVDATNGSNISTGTVAAARIDTAMATDSEVAAAVAGKANLSGGNTFSGIQIQGGAQVLTPTSMSSSVTIDVTLPWQTKTLSSSPGDITFAFSATPGAGTLNTVEVYNGDTTKHRVTHPSATAPGGGTRTYFDVLPGGTEIITFQRTAAALNILGSPQAGYSTEETIASATAVDLSTLANLNVAVSGTTTVAGFGAGTGVPIGTVYNIRPTGAFAITNSSTQINVSGSDITTVAGDTFTLRFEGSSTWRMLSYQRATGAALVGSATGNSLTTSVTQSSHGFTVKQAVYFNGTAWALAKADALSTSKVHGVVSTVTDSNNFIVTTSGSWTTSGFTANTVYYLSDTTAGLLTSTAPTTTTSYLVQVMSTGSATAAYVNVSTPASLALIGPADGGSGVATAYGAYDVFTVHGADVASAGTLNLDTATGNLIDVTGTTTVTAITLADGRNRMVRFTGALTLTHGSSLVLPSAANITTAAGDFAIFRGYAAGIVRCAFYQRASGTALIGSGTAANPSATIGASAVNGSATTYMRSDAAPAIGTNAVTNALLAQMAAHTFKGNNTGGTTNSVDLTIAQMQVELGVNPNAKIVTSTSHGLTVGTLYGMWNSTGTTWVKADASSTGLGKISGIAQPIDANTFTLIESGDITTTGLTAGAQYYLTDDASGLLTTTSPTTTTSFQVPVLLAGSTTLGVVKLQAPASLAKISPNTDIAWTATNNSATAGTIGEFVSSYVASGSAVSLTTATAANMTSISLTAGDWDVEGNLNFSASSATVTGTQGGISSTSATLPTDGSEVFSGVQVTIVSETDSVTLPRKRLSLSGTTTVYAVAKSTFSAGTVGVFGGLTARRVR